MTARILDGKRIADSLLDDLRKLTGGWPAEAVDGPWTPLALTSDEATRLFRQLDLRLAG